MNIVVDNVNFAKFCRDCPHLIGPSFTLVDVDLTFCKVKLKRERRITYAMFLEAMGIMALKKYPNLTLNHGQQLDPPNTVITLEKTQLSLEQYQRQVHMVNTLSRVNSASQAEVQDLEDRIKFCYMLQDEVAELVSDLPRGYEAYRRICKEVEILSANLEASVKYMAKVHLHRSGVVVAEDSPRKRENAALNKLFPHGMAPGIQETMKQIMQAEHNRVRFKDAKRPVDDKDDDGDDADSFRPSEFSDLCLGHMEDTAHNKQTTSHMKKKSLLPSIRDNTGCPADELEVRQMLGEVTTLLHEPTTMTRRKPSAPKDGHVDDAIRLFLEAQVASVKLRAQRPAQNTLFKQMSYGSSTSQWPLDDRFKLIGTELVQGMWTQITDVVASKTKWDIQLLVTYIKLNPTPDAWQLYLDTRRASFVTRSPDSLDNFLRHVPALLKEDLDVFCIPCDGAPLSIFPAPDIQQDAIERMNQVVDSVYGPTLRALLGTRIKALVADSTGWMDKSSQSLQLPFVSYAPAYVVQPQSREYAYPYAPHANRSLLGSSNSMANVGALGRSFRFSIASPRGTKAGGQGDVDVLLANPSQHGVWLQFAVSSLQFSDTSAPAVLMNGIYVFFGDLETVHSRCKKKIRVDIKACIGWAVLALVSPANAPSPTWIEATIESYRKDDNSCQVVLTPSASLFESWLPLDTHIRMAPSDPKCRIHAGKRWLALVDEINTAAHVMSGYCPDPCRRHVESAMWATLSNPFRPADFIFSRYLRSAIHDATRREIVLESRAVGQFNADTGVYGYPVRVQEHLLRARCESVATIMYDVSDCLHLCIRSNAHMSIARLFVQVIQEELSVFLREIAKSTMGDTTTALESLVETAVGLGLMLDTWQTHTQAKIFDRAPTPTTQWTHDTFAKVCATILATKHTVLACIYAQWRRECTQSYFPNVAQHGWSSVKPYFGDSRISAGVQCLVFRVDSLVSRVVSACAMPFGNAVTTRPMQCMCWSMVLHGLECFSALYKAIQVSRARLWQFKMDVLYMLCGMYRSTQRIRELDTADDDMSMCKNWRYT
ncbi:hypothetical protein DYB36_010916 [Aphanomyces astaci]|uniref:Uncharacterized protein n=1 Tax=Aphanomyces astaci TaxID=112090 RepID=A0A397AUC7_APHAT|nr:hypothetical protein DYB36_010916 [Aphanomyces astaci]